MRPWKEKPETPNWRLDLTGPGKPSKTRGLSGTGHGLDRQAAAGWVFWRFWNRTEPCFWSKHGPLAGYPELLLTLPLPHFQKVVDLIHSVRLPVLGLFLHFWVVFCARCIQFWVSACQNPVIGWSILPNNHLIAKRLACDFWLRPADNISAKGDTGLHPDTMWNDRE